MKFSLTPLVFAVLITAQAYGAANFSEDILKERDPFKRPVIHVPQEGPHSELQIFPIEKLKMLGVMAGGQHLIAMVQAPNGKTYFVEERTLIGVRKGIIRKITDKAIIVREKIVNVLGQEETVESRIDLPAESKQDVKQITSEKGW